jgi:putative SOS response-associated peptidase YedK
MCNEAARRIALGQIREDFAQLRIPLRFPEGLPNLAPLESVRITDTTLILRGAADGAVEGSMRRWSWPGQGGRPVYNFRSEGRSLPAESRCLIPVDAFFEFTDPPADAPKRARKTRWRFSLAPDAFGAPAFDPPWFCIAGVRRREASLGEGAAGEAFAMLTCDPGPDVAPYHRRQVVLPRRDQWAGWLDGSLPAADVCRPAPAGMLQVKRA